MGLVREICLAGRPIGSGHPPFIVAEAGINHNGVVATALEMVAVAKRAGADAIKFQTFKADEFCGDPTQLYTYRSQGREVTEPMRDMFRRYELPHSDWFEIKAECERQGIVFLSTPQNRSDLDLLLRVGVPAVKVGSDDFTNLPLLASYAETGLPLLLSCGMADLAEVHRALDVVGALDGYPVVLLLCTSQYPTPPQDVNLRKLKTLQGAFPDLPLGFSDHTRGVLAAVSAVALGAVFFEKHFTLDQQAPGPDHWFSANPDELAEWVAAIRTAFEMLGQPLIRPTAQERVNKLAFRRVIVAARPIGRGQRLCADDLRMMRVGSGLGLSADVWSLLLGRVARRDYAENEPLEL